jgi:hypothetical protein
MNRLLINKLTHKMVPYKKNKKNKKKKKKKKIGKILMRNKIIYKNKESLET